MEKMRLQPEDGMDTVDANICRTFGDERDYGVKAQNTRELGAHKMRLLTNNSETCRFWKLMYLEIVRECTG